jgi:hypothetical protein
MKKIAKLIVVSVFALGALFLFLSSNRFSMIGEASFSDAAVQPTPPKNQNSKPANANTGTAPPTGANMIANSANASIKPIASPTSVAANVTANANATVATSGGKTMKEHFTLGQDSEDEKYGEVAFNHNAHAFKNYSSDGKSPISCVECHHTDQPKSALKSPLETSEREVALTFDSWKASPKKVNECRTCHFQDTNIPDGKEIPTATYTDGGKSTTKELNNKLAYHINCNNCHDEALKKRPELKAKPGFASGSPQDCGICHKLK